MPPADTLASSLPLSPLAGTSYDAQWAELDDFIRYNPGARHRRRLLLSMVKGLSFQSVADVGCGPGETLLSLLKHYPRLQHLSGFDFAEETIASNRQRLPGIHFGFLDIQKGPGDGQYDLVICSEVIEHLDNQPLAVQHLAKMVKPGGHLLLSCPTGKIYPTEVNFGHVKHPTLQDMAALARQAGLTLKKTRNWGWPLYKLQKAATNVNADWAIRQFASGRYSTTKKWLNNLLYWVNFCNLSLDQQGCQLFVLMQKQGQ
jgi:2-polyprenyl-3-methyl-5-hydroxy-6-metoxy-1,4-benzoquinol methylase